MQPLFARDFTSRSCFTTIKYVRIPPGGWKHLCCPKWESQQHTVDLKLRASGKRVVPLLYPDVHGVSLPPPTQLWWAPVAASGSGFLCVLLRTFCSVEFERFALDPRCTDPVIFTTSSPRERCLWFYMDKPIQMLSKLHPRHLSFGIFAIKK